jgi:hypothetical protein
VIWYALTLFLGFLLGLFVAALLSAGAQSDPLDSEALSGSLADWGQVLCGSGGATVVGDLSRVMFSDEDADRLNLRTPEVTQDQWPTSNSGGYSSA